MDTNSIKKRLEKRVDREERFTVRLKEEIPEHHLAGKKVVKLFFAKNSKNLFLVQVVRKFKNKSVENFIFFAWKTTKNSVRTKLIRRFAGKQKFHSLSVYSEFGNVLITFISDWDKSMSFTQVPLLELKCFMESEAISIKEGENNEKSH